MKSYNKNKWGEESDTVLQIYFRLPTELVWEKKKTKKLFSHLSVWILYLLLYPHLCWKAPGWTVSECPLLTHSRLSLSNSPTFRRYLCCLNLFCVAACVKTGCYFVLSWGSNNDALVLCSPHLLLPSMVWQCFSVFSAPKVLVWWNSSDIESCLIPLYSYRCLSVNCLARSTPPAVRCGYAVQSYHHPGPRED